MLQNLKGQCGCVCPLLSSTAYEHSHSPNEKLCRSKSNPRLTFLLFPKVQN